MQICSGWDKCLDEWTWPSGIHPRSFGLHEYYYILFIYLPIYMYADIIPFSSQHI